MQSPLLPALARALNSDLLAQTTHDWAAAGELGAENGGPDVIGYAINDNRVEWRLPEGWADELGEPVFFQ